MSIQISIKKQEQITNQGLFSSMEEAQAWLTKHEGMKTFGQPKQIIQQQIELEPAVIEKQMILVKEAQLDEEGMEIAPAEYEEQDVVVKEAVMEIQEVELAGEYEIVIEDLSARIAQEKINAEALAYLSATDFYIIRELDNGIPCPAEIKAERQAARDRIVK